MKKIKICVIGLGYIGLPTALLFAKAGFCVVGFDVNKKKINELNNKVIPFVEPGLKELFEDAKDNFRASDKIEHADIFIICVPTPITKQKSCDLDFVKKAAKSVSDVLRKGDLVILESTVSPGTTKGILRKILEKSGLRAGRDFLLSYVSEKAIPGKTIFEMQHNTRIIGAISKRSGILTKKLYSSFVDGEIIITTPELAEVAKLMENTFRDVNIALANEFKRICDELGVDVLKAIELANKHPRVNILKPGVGVGGHCLPIDPWFLIENIKSGELIRVARKINDSQPKYIIKRIKKLIKDKNIRKPIIGLLSIGYKPSVDDIRESPMIKLYELLKKSGFEVLATDPLVKDTIITLKKRSEVLKKANILIDHEKIILKKKLKTKKESTDSYK